MRPAGCRTGAPAAGPQPWAARRRGGPSLAVPPWRGPATLHGPGAMAPLEPSLLCPLPPMLQERRGQPAHAGGLRALPPPRARLRAWRVGAWRLLPRLRPLVRPRLCRRPAAAAPAAADAARRHRLPARCSSRPAGAAVGPARAAPAGCHRSAIQGGGTYRRSGPCSRRPGSSCRPLLAGPLGRQPAAWHGGTAAAAAAAGTAAQRCARGTGVPPPICAALPAACELPAANSPPLWQQLLGGHRQHASACLWWRQHQPGGQPQQPALGHLGRRRTAARPGIHSGGCCSGGRLRQARSAAAKSACSS